jgi:hypothetical protein
MHNVCVIFSFFSSSSSFIFPPITPARVTVLLPKSASPSRASVTFRFAHLLYLPITDEVFVTFHSCRSLSSRVGRGSKSMTSSHPFRQRRRHLPLGSGGLPMFLALPVTDTSHVQSHSIQFRCSGDNPHNESPLHSFVTTAGRSPS